MSAGQASGATADTPSAAPGAQDSRGGDASPLPELLPSAPGRLIRPRTWPVQARDLALVVGIAALYRLAVLTASSAPLFFSDSGGYILRSVRPVLRWDRPVGTGAFYDAVLSVWHHPLAVVAAQTLLGLTVVAMAHRTAAAHLALPRRWAIGVALLVGLAPSNLFFERLYMSESLSAALTMAAVLLLGECLRRPVWWLWCGLGLVLAAGVLVRLQMTVTSLALLGALVLLWRSGPWWRRLVAAALVAAAAAVPLLLYAEALGDATRAVRGEAANALSYTDGFSLFAKVAPLLRCPPDADARRLTRDLCDAGPEYLENPNEIVWGGRGRPVTDMLRAEGAFATNEALRAEARAIIKADPGGYADTVVDALAGSFTIRDPEAGTFSADPQDLNPGVGKDLRKVFGVQPEDWAVPEADEAGFWVTAHTWWNGVRQVAWLGTAAGLALALALGGRRARPDPARDLVAVVATALALTVVGVALNAAMVIPRYWYPYEAPAWLLTAWVSVLLAAAVRSRRAGGRSQVSDAR